MLQHSPASATGPFFWWRWYQLGHPWCSVCRLWDGPCSPTFWHTRAGNTTFRRPYSKTACSVFSTKSLRHRCPRRYSYQHISYNPPSTQSSRSEPRNRCRKCHRRNLRTFTWVLDWLWTRLFRVWSRRHPWRPSHRRSWNWFACIHYGYMIS